MNKKLILIVISLVAIFSVWYNRGIFRIGVAEGQTERRFGEEIIVCTTEIPIGEAIEESWHFACQLSTALLNIQQAIAQYRKTVKEITDLARQCSASSCSPVCIPGEECSTTCDYFVTPPACTETCVPTCTTKSCVGSPCPQAEIENKYAKLASISATIKKEQATVNQLLDAERPKIKNKLDEARRLFEKAAPTTEQYQLFRGPTTCTIAVKNFLVKLEDIQKGLVCKSPYNYLICR